MSNYTTKAVITTLDNLANNREQIRILSNEVDETIVVNNGSIDGTKEWLDSLDNITVIHRENNGAGPGRNAGLDAAGEFDYVLLLDGGIRPLIGGVDKMLDYLETTPEADVIGVEIFDLETDYSKAWRRWPEPITQTYRNTRLSHTAYCLARYKAFDGIRFNETGPFGEAGWGCDDDELMCQWNGRGIVLHVVEGVHPYRRASGSFRRLYDESGIWPNQYGSVYEKRLVWLQQNYPQYKQGIQWGEPWLTVVTDNKDLIVEAHRLLRRRMFARPWHNYPNPYSIILQTDDLQWTEDRCLRQWHGDTMIIEGEIVRHKPRTEAKDFRVNGEVRPGAFYWGRVSTGPELNELVKKYDEIHPPQPAENLPGGERWPVCLTE